MLDRLERNANLLAFLGLLLLACVLSGAVVYLWFQLEPGSQNATEVVVETEQTAIPLAVPIPSATPVVSPTHVPPPATEVSTAQPEPTLTDSVEPLESIEPADSPEASPTPDPAPEEAISDSLAVIKGNPGFESAPPDIHDTETLLFYTDVPVRDRLDLARRFALSDQPIPAVVNPEPPSYSVGDRQTFWVGESDSARYFEAPALLRHVGEHSYWWVDEGYPVDESALVTSAGAFESNIYPRNREFFGSEWSPGVDNDPRIHIFIGNVPGVGGYFYSTNEYSHIINPFSNEKEMFYININAARPGSDSLDSILAHEFQHMIHWNRDANEATWVNEGLSELAMFLNGYDTGNVVGAFMAAPGTQLNAWADSPSQSIPHYGASYLFMKYVLERFGEEPLRRLVGHPENGIKGFNTLFAELGLAYRFDDVFGDWVVANYLDDPEAGQGNWGYRDLATGPVQTKAVHGAYPIDQEGTVKQYAADYYVFEGQGTLTIDFCGPSEVKIAPNQAHSGAHQWWSNRGDDSDMTLTRQFDLTGVDQATLKFWTWYDIEMGWDFAYAEVSTDGGKTWTIVPGLYSTMDNASGNSFGPAWTGASGGLFPEWVEEQIDLTPYVGQEIYVRFEYVTDDAVDHVGLMLDDINIPEIGYSDDAESGDGFWVAEGFARIDNILPQRFLVQLIEQGQVVQVQGMDLDENNCGQLSVSGLGDTVDQAVLAVSGVTPFTTEPAHYRYQADITNP